MNLLTRTTLLLVLAIGLLTPGALIIAQTNPGEGLDQSTRLMQEYMAKREEWFALRRSALVQINGATSEAEKKQLQEKLAQDEKPYLARITIAARAYAAAEKARQGQLTPTPPSAPRG